MSTNIAWLIGGVALGWGYLQLWQPSRVMNFSAGPGTMTDNVMQQAQAEFLSWHGTGMNMMEISHRDVGGPVQSMMSGAADNVRQLLEVRFN